MNINVVRKRTASFIFIDGEQIREMDPWDENMYCEAIKDLASNGVCDVDITFEDREVER